MSQLHGSVSSWCEPIQIPDIPEQMKCKKAAVERAGQVVFKDLKLRFVDHMKQ